MAAEREHSSSTSPPVRMVTMPAVSSSPLLWETVSWRQLSTVLYRCLKRGRGAIFQISGLCWRRGSKSEDTAELTRLQGPAVWVCLFQNCDPTLSDSGCTCRQKEELQKPSNMDVTETFLLREAGWKIQTGWNLEKKITSRPSFQAKMSTLEKVLFKISNTWLTVCEDKTCKRPEWLMKGKKKNLTCCLFETQTQESGFRLWRQRFPFSTRQGHRSLRHKPRPPCQRHRSESVPTSTPRWRALTCTRDDDDEAAASSQLPDETQVLAEGGRVGDQVRRHGGLSFGLLKAAL